MLGKEWATYPYGIPVFQPNTLGNLAAHEFIRGEKCLYTIKKVVSTTYYYWLVIDYIM